MKKKWYARAIGGESRLIKTFWLGLIGYIFLSSFFLQVSTVAIVYDQNMYTNPLLADKSAFDLLRPALLLLGMSLVYGFYTTFAAASIWQSAYNYPPEKWAIWPNLAFFLTVAGSFAAAIAIIFNLQIIWNSFSQVLAHGGM